MIEKYRKKPVVIDTVQWKGTFESLAEIREFMKPNYPKIPKLPDEISNPSLFIETLEGTHEAKVNDWIIKGVHGEYYPCKPDIFEKTYELAGIEPATPVKWVDRPDKAGTWWVNSKLYQTQIVIKVHNGINSLCIDFNRWNYTIDEFIETVFPDAKFLYQPEPTPPEGR